MAEKLTYDVRQAAELMGVSKELLWRQIWSGAIPHIRIGRRVLISRRTLERILEGETPASRGPEQAA